MWISVICCWLSIVIISRSFVVQLSFAQKKRGAMSYWRLLAYFRVCSFTVDSQLSLSNHRSRPQLAIGSSVFWSCSIVIDCVSSIWLIWVCVRFLYSFSWYSLIVSLPLGHSVWSVQYSRSCSITVLSNIHTTETKGKSHMWSRTWGQSRLYRLVLHRLFTLVSTNSRS